MQVLSLLLLLLLFVLLLLLLLLLSHGSVLHGWHSSKGQSQIGSRSKSSCIPKTPSVVLYRHWIPPPQGSEQGPHSLQSLYQQGSLWSLLLLLLLFELSLLLLSLSLELLLLLSFTLLLFVLLLLSLSLSLLLFVLLLLLLLLSLSGFTHLCGAPLFVTLNSSV